MAARAETAQSDGQEGASGDRTDLTGLPLRVCPSSLAYGLSSLACSPGAEDELLQLRAWWGPARRTSSGSPTTGSFSATPTSGAQCGTRYSLPCSRPRPWCFSPLVFALLANRAIPARWFFRVAFFAPWPAAPRDGSAYLGLVVPAGFRAHQRLPRRARACPRSPWLAGESAAMISVVIATVWWTLGFNFMLYLAGCRRFPQESTTPSAADGAGPLSADTLDHDPAPGRGYDLDRHPPDLLFAKRVRPDLRHEHLGGPQLHGHPPDHPVHLRAGLHFVPDRVRLGHVIRVLRARSLW